MSYINDLQSPHASIRARAEKVMDELREGVEYTVDADGVLRNRINRVPPSDIIDLAEMVGVEFDRAATEAADKAALAEMIDEMKRSQQEHADRVAAGDPEALDIERERQFELRAAFGEGETVVDVFTGRRTRT